MINIFELLLTNNIILTKQNKQKLQNLISSISSKTDYLRVIKICIDLLDDESTTIPSSIDDIHLNPSQMSQILNYLGINYFDILLQRCNQSIDQYVGTQQPEHSIYKNKILSYNLDIKNLNTAGELLLSQYFQPMYRINTI